MCDTKFKCWVQAAPSERGAVEAVEAACICLHQNILRYSHMKREVSVYTHSLLALESVAILCPSLWMCLEKIILLRQDLMSVLHFLFTTEDVGVPKTSGWGRNSEAALVRAHPPV